MPIRLVEKASSSARHTPLATSLRRLTDRTDPRTMAPPELAAVGHRPSSPLQAIYARCLDCCAGSADELRKCVSLTLSQLVSQATATKRSRARGCSSDGAQVATPPA